MKKNLLLLISILLLSQIEYAQTRREVMAGERRMKNSMELFEDDADFSRYVIPDSFKKAPAVIICHSVQYLSKAKTGIFSQLCQTTIRRKVAILEKTALEDFSTLYFDLDLENRNNLVVVRVIKPGGKQNTITGQDAIKVDKGKIPRIYRTSNRRDQIYYKMAIPDLEKGDTLEYVLQSLPQNHDPNSLPYGYYQAVGKFPIVKQKILFGLNAGQYLAAKSVHGVPKIKSMGANDRSTQGFIWEDSNRSGFEDENWLFDYRERPHFKYRVFNKVDKTFFIQPKVGEVQSGLDEWEVRRKFGNFMEQIPMVRAYGKFINPWRNIKDQDELVEWIYNSIRSDRRDNPDVAPDEAFTSLMCATMARKKIPFGLIAVPIRTLSDLDDALLFNEIIFGIKYKDHFIFPAQCNSNVYSSDKFCEGQKAYMAIMDHKGRGVESVEEITIPYSAFTDNMSIDHYVVTMDGENLDQLKVTDTAYYRGINKREYRNYLKKLAEMTKKEDKQFLLEEEEKVEPEHRSNDKMDEAKRKKEEGNRVEYQQFVDSLKERYENVYGKIHSIDTFYHIQSGTKKEDKDLIEFVAFTVGDLTKKVGNNYVVELGKIIGKQAEIAKDERNRRNNIWIDNEQTIRNNIRFKIPEGYKAEGMENYNFNIDNEAGKFVSKATIENGYVVLTTEKIYKKSYLPKEKWNDFMAFLDAAYDFTQKQIILKKQ